MKTIEALFRKGGATSREIAKERLRLVLINDRSGISPHILNAVKDELIQVLSKYLEIDPNSIKISFSHSKERDRLIADIPILGLRSRPG